MTDLLTIRVYEGDQLVCTTEVAGPVELGRQSTREEEVYAQKRPSNTSSPRLVIAHLHEDTVSRKHVLIEPLSDGRLRLTNVSDIRPIRMPDGTALRPKASCEVPVPAVFTIGAKTIRIERPAPEAD